MELKNLIAGFFVCCILISSAAGAANDGANEMVNKSKNLSLPVKSPGNLTLGSKESMYQYQRYVGDTGRSLLDFIPQMLEIFGLGNQASTQNLKDIMETGLNMTDNITAQELALLNTTKHLSPHVKSPGNITLGSKESMYQYQKYMKDSGKSLLDSTSAILGIFGLEDKADTQIIKDITERSLNTTNTDGKTQSFPQPATTQDLSAFLDDDVPPPLPTDLTINSMSVVTASNDGNHIHVNYMGGLDRSIVNTIEVQFTPAGGIQSKNTLKNEPGTQITFNRATLWKDHIVVLAIRTDGTNQVIYDDYV